MFSMILQLGGLGNLIVGILQAATGAYVKEEESRNRKSKCCYQ